MKRLVAALAILAVAIGLVADRTPAAFSAASTSTGADRRVRSAPVDLSSGSTWASTGGPAGGNLSGVAVSPAYNVDHTVYGWNNFAGVYRSLDGGVTWSNINNGLAGITLNVGALAISNYFNVDNTIFIGTDRGVFRSTDRGATWVQSTTGLTNLDVRSIAISPVYNTDRTVFVGTDGGGIFVSKDAGDTWAPTSAAVPDGQVWTLAVSANFANDRTLFAGAAFGGFFVTHDAGATWSVLSNAFNNVWVRSLGITPFFGNNIAQRDCVWTSSTNQNCLKAWVVLVGTAFHGVTVSLLVSKDGSDAVFFGEFANLTNLDAAQVNSVAFSPEYPTDGIIYASTGPGTPGGPVQWARVVFCGGPSPGLARPGNPICNMTVTPGGTNSPPAATVSGTYDSSTCGTFSNYVVTVTAVTPTRTFQITRNNTVTGTPSTPPNTFSIGCGLSMTVPPGDSAVGDTYAFQAGITSEHWTGISSGLDKNQDVRGLAISPNYRADGTVFAGTWGNMAYRIQVFDPRTPSNGSPSWGQAPILPNASMVRVLAAVQTGTAPDANSIARLYAGTFGNGVYRRDTNGSWTDITSNLPMTNRDVRAIVAFTDTVIIGTFGSPGTPGAGGIWRTGNATANLPTWTNIGHSGNGLLSSDIRALAISPGGATIVAGTNGSGVYVSTDGGVSWRQVINGLNPDGLTVRAVAVAPAWNSGPDQRIIIGTDSGFWMLPPKADGTLNLDGSWVHFNNNLAASGTSGTAFGQMIVTAVAFSPDFNGRASPSTGRLFAGVWGGGVYVGAYNGDGGNPRTVTWTVNTIGMSNGDLYPRSIVPSPSFATDQNVFASTLTGVWQSPTGGLGWTPLRDGLGTTVTESLNVLATSDPARPFVLFTGTAGAGVWAMVDPMPIFTKKSILPVIRR